MQPLGKTTFGSSKTQTEVNVGSSDFMPRYASGRTDDRFSNKDVNMNVRSCVIHNSQEANTTQIAINLQTSAQNCGVYIIDG